MTNGIGFKRIMAYFIDLLIISFIASMLSKVNAINPNINEYEKTMKAYTAYSTELQESFGNTTVSPSDIITPEYKGFMYDLGYYGISFAVIEFSVIILYFTFFPLLFNGQTIGKKLMKKRIVNDDETAKVPFYKYLIRSLLIPMFTGFVLYTSLFKIINTFLLLGLNVDQYFKMNLIVTLIFCIYAYADIFVMFARNDKKSLHDLITKTSIIAIEK